MHFTFWKLADFNIIASLFFLIAAWKWGDWHNWRKYYPTIIFFLLINYAYGYITYNYPLWQFESPLLKTTLCDIFVSIVAYPSTILLFLPHYPNTLYKRIFYILMWVTLYSILEFFSFKLGFFSYHNGWNMWWSVLFNGLMFPIFRLHHQNPLYAWSFTLILAVAILLFFNFPCSSMK